MASREVRNSPPASFLEASETRCLDFEEGGQISRNFSQLPETDSLDGAIAFRHRS